MTMQVILELLFLLILGVWILFQIPKEIRSGKFRSRSRKPMLRKDHPTQFKIGIILQGIIGFALVMFGLIGLLISISH